MNVKYRLLLPDSTERYFLSHRCIRTTWLDDGCSLCGVFKYGKTQATQQLALVATGFLMSIWCVWAKTVHFYTSSKWSPCPTTKGLVYTLLSCC